MAFRTPATSVVLFRGQSLANYGQAPGVAYDYRFPTLIMGGRDKAIRWRNCHVDGDSWTTLLANAPTQLDPYMGDATKVIVVLACSGQSDFAVPTPDTAAECYDDMMAVSAAARAAGATHVIGTTTPPMTEAWSVFFERNQIAPLNTLLLADPGDCDVIVDCHTGILSDPAGAAFEDGLHFTYLGASEVRDRLNPEIDAALAE
jgi:hypothetical protein